jgi:flagellar basal body P-ring formation protein FlgA
MTENANVKVEDKKTIFLKRAVIFYLFLLILFFSLVFIVHAIAMTIITIPGKVELDKNIIMLEDIANFQGENSDMQDKMKGVELGIAPSPGEEKTIDKNYIILRLKKEGINTKDFELLCDEKIILHRISASLSKDELENIVKEKIGNYIGVQSDKFKIKELKGLEDISIPKGEVTYKLDIRRNMSTNGRIVGNLNILVDAKLYKKIWIQARLAISSKVAKLIRDIKKGNLITKEDVVFEVSLQNDISRDYISSDEDLFGLIASRNMSKGMILYKGLFTKPNLINRGDNVIIEMDMETLKITATGIAIENGGIGDMIKVTSDSSKKVLKGKITSKGKVVIG